MQQPKNNLTVTVPCFRCHHLASCIALCLLCVPCWWHFSFHMYKEDWKLYSVKRVEHLLLCYDKPRWRHSVLQEDRKLHPWCLAPQWADVVQQQLRTAWSHHLHLHLKREQYEVDCSLGQVLQYWMESDGDIEADIQQPQRPPSLLLDSPPTQEEERQTL